MVPCRRTRRNARSGWQKSSFSEGGAPNCVEVATDSAGIYVRESEAPAEAIATSPAALRGMVRSVKSGRFEVFQ
ncbi:DUF397 domain-containing protein [Streptomyces sp. NPDC003077]|uniref:DUF397 domain-containing protein n=1 Tax=Streptomyces sp. NPDC003077 TaxID=3154443 RepID=UPI0033AFBE5C